MIRSLSPPLLLKLVQNVIPTPFLEITDQESVKAAAKKAEARLEGSGLNLLINNAGILLPATLETVTAKDMMDGYNTNVVGSMLVTQVSQEVVVPCFFQSSLPSKTGGRPAH